jgi:hypothetical protein
MDRLRIRRVEHHPHFQSTLIVEFSHEQEQTFRQVVTWDKNVKFCRNIQLKIKLVSLNVPGN